MAAKKKAAPTKKAPAPKAAKAPKFQLDDEKVESLPGGGRQFATVVAASAGGKAVVKITHAKGQDSYHPSVEGVIARSHPWRKFTMGAYDRDNPQPPDCGSMDGVNGVAREGSQIVAYPGYTGKCEGCPFAFARGGCNMTRAVYLFRTDDGYEEGQKPLLVQVSRTANRGDASAYEETFAGKREIDHKVKIYAELRTNKSDATHPVLRFQITGDNDLDTWGPRIVAFREQLEGLGQYLLPKAGEAKQLTGKTTVTEVTEDTFD